MSRSRRLPVSPSRTIPPAPAAAGGGGAGGAGWELSSGTTRGLSLAT